MNQNEIPPAEPSEAPEEPSPMQPTPTEETEEPAPEQPAIPPEGKEPKKKPSSLLRAFRWLLIVLIMIGIGAVLTIFMLYVPARDDLINARQRIKIISNQSEADLKDAQDEIKRLSEFEEQNQTLQEENERTLLQITLLQARTDILTAHLALMSGDKEKALLAISTTPETLDFLTSLLPAENSDFVDSLQKRLELAQEGIENDDSAAESDLSVLVVKLLELEDAILR